MEVFVSAEITYSSSVNAVPSQTRAYRSSTVVALAAKSGSLMKIHDWCCHGLIASSASHRPTAEEHADEQIPSTTACKPVRGSYTKTAAPHLASGGWQASALTLATCTGLNRGGRPERFASPSEPTPGWAHHRWRHLRAVSTLTATRAAITVFDRPCSASSTILARHTSC